jgi:hypothetical protein
MGARSWCASTEAARKNEYGGNRLSISTKDHIAVKLSHRTEAHLSLISAPAIEKCADEAAGRAIRYEYRRFAMPRRHGDNHG